MRHLLSLSAIESAKILEKGGYKPYVHLSNMVPPRAFTGDNSYKFYLSSDNNYNSMVIQTFIKKLNNKENSYVTILYKLPHNFLELPNTEHKYNTTFTFTLCFLPCAIHLYKGKTNRLVNSPGSLFYNENLTNFANVRQELANINNRKHYAYYNYEMKKSISNKKLETSLRDLESGNYTIQIHKNRYY